MFLKPLPLGPSACASPSRELPPPPPNPMQWACWWMGGGPILFPLSPWLDINFTDPANTWTPSAAPRLLDFHIELWKLGAARRPLPGNNPPLPRSLLLSSRFLARSTPPMPPPITASPFVTGLHLPLEPHLVALPLLSQTTTTNTRN